MAIKVLLTYEGGGAFSCPWEHDVIECMEKLQQGERVRATITRPRSRRQTRTFFGVISKAFENQQSVENIPEFDDREHLRAWLLVQAGYCNSADIEPEACTPSSVSLFRRLAKQNHLFFYNLGDIIRIKWAKSIDHATIDHDDFQPVCQEVFRVIEASICPGTTVEELIAMIGHDT